MNNNDNDRKNRIVNIDNLDIIINGGDLDMEINYYGRTTTARQIMNKYRNY
jgi:hypothetical protein